MMKPRRVVPVSNDAYKVALQGGWASFGKQTAGILQKLSTQCYPEGLALTAGPARRQEISVERQTWQG